MGKARMTPCVLRYAALLALIFALFIGSARALPEPEPDLTAYQRLFYESDGCVGACLLGIMPGMPLNDALTLLHENDWVYGVTSPDTFQREVSVAWHWTGRQPDIIDSSVPGFLYSRSDGADTGHFVVGIAVETTLRLSGIQRALGPTDRGGTFYWAQTDQITYNVSYYDADLRLRTTLSADLRCPARPIQYYWHPHMQVTQQAGLSLFPYVQPETLPELCQAAHSG